MNHDALDVRNRRSTGTHVGGEISRYWRGTPTRVDTDEDELRAGDESVVPCSPCCLTHGKAGSPVMSQGLVESKHISRKRGGPVIDDRLPYGRPAPRPSEHIHAGTPEQHLPTGSLEQGEE